MTLIDGDKIVTAQLYDDEHEEFTEKKMSIIDYVNTYTDEGVTTADDVLAQIRAEIEARHMGDYPNVCVKAWNEAIEKVLDIIEKYKGEGSGEE